MNGFPRYLKTTVALTELFHSSPALTFKKFQKMIEKKIIETLTRCYYDEFSGCPYKNIEHNKKMELRSSSSNFRSPQRQNEQIKTNLGFRNKKKRKTNTGRGKRQQTHTS